MPNQKSTKHRAAFSLVELLVVIGIIALFAAILFPVYTQVRAKARQTACTSNLRQLSLALAAYTEDSDECLPFLAFNEGNHLGDDWQIVMNSYSKSANIWQCPDASDYATNGVDCRAFGLPHLVAPSGYSYNETAGASTTPGQINADGPTNGKTFSPAYLSQCGHPAQTLLFMDKGYGALFTPWTKWNARLQNACHVEDKFMTGPHHHGKNVAFADGHVRWMQGQAILTQDQHSASGVNSDPRSSFFSYYTN